MLSLPRTFLYVPGDRPDRFTKAVRSGADAVVLDLEDAVHPTSKAAARHEVRAFLRSTDVAATQLWVRINRGEEGVRDAEGLSGMPSLAGLVVPKASVASVHDVHDCTAVPLCALVEGAKALIEVNELAASPGVQLLAMGEVDFAADLRLGSNPPPALIWSLRVAVVVAAAAAGLAPPVGPVHVDVPNLDGLAHTTTELLEAGFWSRQLIHPSHVSVVHEALAPTTDQIADATALLTRFDRGGAGAFVDDEGRMIDEAVVRSVRLLVERGRT